MFTLFMFTVLSCADQDYISSKFVYNLNSEGFDIHFYYQLRVCSAGGKEMAVPYNSTHFEMKRYEDDECKVYKESVFKEGTYFDDITTNLENCYAYIEQADKDTKHTASYITFAHRYCNTYKKDMLLYVDYNDGFFYLNKDIINATLVIYPTCIATDESKSDTFVRFYRNVWRFPSYQRTNLGGKGIGQEAECDDADPLALIVVFIIGLLLF